MIPFGPLPVLLGVLVVVALGGVAVWFRYHEPGTNDEEDATDDDPADDGGFDIPDIDIDDVPLPRRSTVRMTVAVLGVIGLFAGFTATAWLGWGPLSGGLFIVGLVLGVSGPPVTILLLRDGIPLNGLIATGLAIAAQIAFGQAALVRREDGRYEWTVLRDARRGFKAVLGDGTHVPIDATEGELFSFGLGDLAVTEAKGTNVDPHRVVHTPGNSDHATEERAGIPIRPPRNEGDGILVSLTKIQRVIRGSASSTLVRRGRDKALDDEGGTGQLSQLWMMGFATVLLVVGFGMTALVLML